MSPECLSREWAHKAAHQSAIGAGRIYIRKNGDLGGISANVNVLVNNRGRIIAHRDGVQRELQVVSQAAVR